VQRPRDRCPGEPLPVAGIDVLGPQCEQFSSSQTAVPAEQHKTPIAAVDRVGEDRELTGIEEPHFFPFDPGEWLTFARR